MMQLRSGRKVSFKLQPVQTLYPLLGRRFYKYMQFAICQIKQQPPMYWTEGGCLIRIFVSRSEVRTSACA
jgi:hypothetical protein